MQSNSDLLRCNQSHSDEISLNQVNPSSHRSKSRSRSLSLTQIRSELFHLALQFHRDTTNFIQSHSDSSKLSQLHSDKSSPFKLPLPSPDSADLISYSDSSRLILIVGHSFSQIVCGNFFDEFLDEFFVDFLVTLPCMRAESFLLGPRSLWL